MKTILVNVPDKDEAFFTMLLKKFKIKSQVVSDSNSDLWNEIPEEIKEEVEAAMAELNAGKGVSHKKVMQNYTKWLKK
jgi:predicted transcriptional regulator